MDWCFKVNSEEEQMLSSFCVSVVCSAPLIRGVKYFLKIQSGIIELSKQTAKTPDTWGFGTFDCLLWL